MHGDEFDFWAAERDDLIQGVKQMLANPPKANPRIEAVRIRMLEEKCQQLYYVWRAESGRLREIWQELRVHQSLPSERWDMDYDRRLRAERAQLIAEEYGPPPTTFASLDPTERPMKLNATVPYGNRIMPAAYKEAFPLYARAGTPPQTRGPHDTTLYVDIKATATTPLERHLFYIPVTWTRDDIRAFCHYHGLVLGDNVTIDRRGPDGWLLTAWQ